MTIKRSSSNSNTMRFPIRRNPRTTWPSTAEIGGSYVRIKETERTRTFSNTRPAQNRSKDSIYTTTSGNSGTNQRYQLASLAGIRRTPYAAPTEKLAATGDTNNGTGRRSVSPAGADRCDADSSNQSPLKVGLPGGEKVPATGAPATAGGRGAGDSNTGLATHFNCSITLSISRETYSGISATSRFSNRKTRKPSDIR